MTYRHDYHTHTSASFDGIDSLSMMAAAAEQAGLDELAITDHCDMGGMQPGTCCPCPSYEFDEARRQTSVSLVRGIELGQPHQDQEGAARLLDEYRPDFVLASLHNLRGLRDFYHLTYTSAGQAHELLRSYWDEMLEIVRWGRFSVLSHLTYPLRYIPVPLGVDITPYYDVFQFLFRLLAEKGLGLEVNVSCLSPSGGYTQPDLPLLKLFRQCGGTIVTVGSDAHRAVHVGSYIDAGLDLLRQAGFEYISSFSGGDLTFMRI